MHIQNSYHIAGQAINQGLKDVNGIAHSIANSINDDAAEGNNIAEDLIELKQVSQHIKANMHVIKTVKETEEFLIDIMA